MKFVCVNKDCEKYGIEEVFTSTSYKMVGGRLVSRDAPCPVCGEERKEVDERALDLSSIQVGKYSSASKEERVNMLKKRSHDHFEKHIKPEKEYRNAELIRQFKEASK